MPFRFRNWNDVAALNDEKVEKLLAEFKDKGFKTRPFKVRPMKQRGIMGRVPAMGIQR